MSRDGSESGHPSQTSVPFLGTSSVAVGPLWITSFGRCRSDTNPFPRLLPFRGAAPGNGSGFLSSPDENRWAGAIADKLPLIDPALHRVSVIFSPSERTQRPRQAWLAMLDSLWNIDKHHSIHIGNVTVELQHLRVVRRSDGDAINFAMGSLGPRGVDLDTLDTEAHLLRLRMTEPWPDSLDKVQVERGVRVNLFLDYGAPGFGKNMNFAQGNMHNAVVLAAHTFEQEFHVARAQPR